MIVRRKAGNFVLGTLGQGRMDSPWEQARNFAVIVGVVVALMSLRTTIVLARRKQSSDLVFSARNDENFVAGIRVLRAHKITDDIALLAVQPGIRSEDAAKVRYVLNYFEAIAVGVRKNIYNEEILFLNYHTTLTHLYDSALPFIRETRRSQDIPTFFKELSWLATRWKKAEVSWIMRFRIEFKWGCGAGIYIPGAY